MTQTLIFFLVFFGVFSSGNVSVRAQDEEFVPLLDFGGVVWKGGFVDLEVPNSASVELNAPENLIVVERLTVNGMLRTLGKKLDLRVKELRFGKEGTIAAFGPDDGAKPGKPNFISNQTPRPVQWGGIAWDDLPEPDCPPKENPLYGRDGRNGGKGQNGMGAAGRPPVQPIHVFSYTTYGNPKISGDGQKGGRGGNGEAGQLGSAGAPGESLDAECHWRGTTFGARGHGCKYSAAALEDQGRSIRWDVGEALWILLDGYALMGGHGQAGGAPGLPGLGGSGGEGGVPAEVRFTQALLPTDQDGKAVTAAGGVGGDPGSLGVQARGGPAGKAGSGDAGSDSDWLVFTCSYTFSAGLQGQTNERTDEFTALVTQQTNSVKVGTTQVSKPTFQTDLNTISTNRDWLERQWFQYHWHRYVLSLVVRSFLLADGVSTSVPKANQMAVLRALLKNDIGSARAILGEKWDRLVWEQMLIEWDTQFERITKDFQNKPDHALTTEEHEALTYASELAKSVGQALQRVNADAVFSEPSFAAMQSVVRMLHARLIGYGRDVRSSCQVYEGEIQKRIADVGDYTEFLRVPACDAIATLDNDPFIDISVRSAIKTRFKPVPGMIEHRNEFVVEDERKRLGIGSYEWNPLRFLIPQAYAQNPPTPTFVGGDRYIVIKDYIPLTLPTVREAFRSTSSELNHRGLVMKLVVPSETQIRRDTLGAALRSLAYMGLQLKNSR